MRFSVMVVLLAFCCPLFAQELEQSQYTVIAVRGNSGLFAKSGGNEFHIGDKMLAISKRDGKQIMIAVVRIMMVNENYYGIKVIEASAGRRLQVGDILIKYEDDDHDNIGAFNSSEENRELSTEAPHTRSRESWYFYSGVGVSNLTYPDELDTILNELKSQPGVSNVRLNLDLLGFYFPLGYKTIIGVIIDAMADRYEDFSNNYFQLNHYLYAASMMHYLFGQEIGRGLFIRFDAGLAKSVVQLSGTSGPTFSDSGFGFVAGGGIGLPISKGTRLLFNANYTNRTIAGESIKAINLSLGGLF